MAKSSGSTKKSTSSNPKGISSIGGGKLSKEGKALGVNASVLEMFGKAESYGSFKNAPESFQKSFSDNASQSVLDFIKNAEKKAAKVRDEKMDSALNSGNKSMYDKAKSEYEDKMADVYAFAQKLRAVQSKFNS